MDKGLNLLLRMLLAVWILVRLVVNVVLLLFLCSSSLGTISYRKLDDRAHSKRYLPHHRPHLKATHWPKRMAIRGQSCGSFPVKWLSDTFLSF